MPRQNRGFQTEQSDARIANCRMTETRAIGWTGNNHLPAVQQASRPAIKAARESIYCFFYLLFHPESEFLSLSLSIFYSGARFCLIYRSDSSSSSSINREGSFYVAPRAKSHTFFPMPFEKPN